MSIFGSCGGCGIPSSGVCGRRERGPALGGRGKMRWGGKGSAVDCCSWLAGERVSRR